MCVCARARTRTHAGTWSIHAKAETKKKQRTTPCECMWPSADSSSTLQKKMVCLGACHRPPVTCTTHDFIFLHYFVCIARPSPAQCIFFSCVLYICTRAHACAHTHAHTMHTHCEVLMCVVHMHTSTCLCTHACTHHAYTL